MFPRTPRTLLRSASSDLTELADVSQNIADSVWHPALYWHGLIRLRLGIKCDLNVVMK